MSILSLSEALIEPRQSLDLLIDAHQTVSELLVLDVGIKIASALDTALKHDLLHRDIKPDNIAARAPV